MIEAVLPRKGQYSVFRHKDRSNPLSKRGIHAGNTTLARLQSWMLPGLIRTYIDATKTGKQLHPENLENGSKVRRYTAYSHASILTRQDAG